MTRDLDGDNTDPMVERALAARRTRIPEVRDRPRLVASDVEDETLAKKHVRVGVVRLVVPIQTQSGANAELLDGEAPGIGLQQGVVQVGRQRKTLSL